ncbi:MAG: Flp pilus assembly complex ATPase component TadA, partial [Puniceicoccales bacterium]|nr:Flp pilus assembly complex ATPase component TadA [Puniceicoccales bacterium]
MISADDYVLQLIQDQGLVAPEAVNAARQYVEGEGVVDGIDTAVLDRLVDQKAITWDQITAALAREFDMEVVDLAEVRPSQEALDFLGKELAERTKTFPLQLNLNEIEIATADPLDTESIDELSRLLKTTITVRLATPQSIKEAFEQYYLKTEEGGAVFDAIFGDKADGMQLDLPTGSEAGVKAEDAPIIRYVNLLITEAIKRRASDIHLEPLEKRFRVRYRIDGVLQEVENPPKRLQASIISRLKLMAEVSLAEKRIPQDGRIQVKAGTKEIDLRVSVLPTVYGESIVMRILDKEGLRLGLPELGFFSDDQAAFQKLVTLPDGIFLVTGPTGSGKTNTLYSALQSLNTPETNIMTAEDPVEFNLLGINQV